jgi:hypothetical protein
MKIAISSELQPAAKSFANNDYKRESIIALVPAEDTSIF